MLGGVSCPADDHAPPSARPTTIHDGARTVRYRTDIDSSPAEVDGRWRSGSQDEPTSVPAPVGVQLDSTAAVAQRQTNTARTWTRIGVRGDVVDGRRRRPGWQWLGLALLHSGLSRRGNGAGAGNRGNVGVTRPGRGNCGSGAGRGRPGGGINGRGRRPLASSARSCGQCVQYGPFISMSCTRATSACDTQPPRLLLWIMLTMSVASAL